MSTRESNLEIELRKKEIDVEYFMAILSIYPEDGYIRTDNSNGHFNVFNQLSEMGLCIKTIIPFWVNGSYKGTQIQFKYNRELDYEKYSPF